jgi:hypothetical protein
MRTLPGSCEPQWRVGLWSEPDTPPLRLRDEALRTALALPPVDYTVKAVGYARQTTDGRAGVAHE